jgi:hypothetical protein
MKTSESIKDISAALAKARKAFHPVVKDKVANVKSDKGSYSFAFADLSSVLDAIKDGLSDNGIAVVQAASTDGAGVTVETRLSHASGEWIESALTMKVDGNRPQNIGSAITYARRYALSAMVGVSSEQDDDANAAEGNDRKIEDRPKTQTAKVKDAVQAIRAQVNDPKLRKAAAFKTLERLGFTDAGMRAKLAELLGRTFPLGKEIILQDKGELERVEALVAHLESTAKHGSDAAHAQ